jgi:hypothetical protein
MTLKEFNQQMKILVTANLNGTKNALRNIETFENWFPMFKGFDKETLTTASNSIIRESEFFPNQGELHRKCYEVSKHRTKTNIRPKQHCEWDDWTDCQFVQAQGDCGDKSIDNCQEKYCPAWEG